MPNCTYIFTNNSKNHKKGEICNAVIRKKGANMCWQHQHTQDQKVEIEHNINGNTENEKINWTQLENSKEK
jgi:hypothetical protein